MKNNVNASEAAFNKIIELIINRSLIPGEVLYETALTEQLQMSRTPIRDALIQLASIGFLDKSKNKRGYSVPVPTPQDMNQVFKLRGLMEGLAIEEATQYVTAQDIEKLRELNRCEIEAFEKKQRMEYANINSEIHFNIIKISRNQYYVRFCTELFWRSNIYNFFFADFYTDSQKANLRQHREHRQRMSCMEHLRIINALAERDAQKSKELMIAHINTTYQSMLSPGVG